MIPVARYAISITETTHINLKLLNNDFRQVVTPMVKGTNQEVEELREQCNPEQRQQVSHHPKRKICLQGTPNVRTSSATYN